MFSYCGCEIQIPSFSRCFMPFFNIIYRVSRCFNHPKLVVFFLSQKIGWGLTPSILQFSCVNIETTPMKQVFYHFIILYHCLVIGRFFAHDFPILSRWSNAGSMPHGAHCGLEQANGEESWGVAVQQIPRLRKLRYTQITQIWLSIPMRQWPHLVADDQMVSIGYVFGSSYRRRSFNQLCPLGAVQKVGRSLGGFLRCTSCSLDVHSPTRSIPENGMNDDDPT